MIKGTLYGVGVGPGDPRLMTYLAVDTIQKCPVIAVPADGKENAVSYKIALKIVSVSLIFMMKSETEKEGIFRVRCVFVVPERRMNGIG